MSKRTLIIMLAATMGLGLPVTMTHAQDTAPPAMTDQQRADRQAAAQIHNRAMAVYESGQLSTAREMFKQAALFSYEPSQFMYGLMVDRNEGEVIVNDMARQREAVRFLTASAARNYKYAYFHLARILLFGDPAIQDFDEAYRYLKQFAAIKDVKEVVPVVRAGDDYDNARKDIRTAKLWLADCYAYGKGVPIQDTKAAMRLYMALAESPEPLAAHTRMGRVLLDTEEFLKDASSARAWFYRGMDKDQAARAEYGYMLINGLGGTKDVKKGKAMIQQAFQAGDAVGIYYTAELNAEGEHVPANKLQAYNYYQQAADKKYPPAIYRYAILTDERNTSNNARLNQTFVKMINEAAQLDFLEAQIYLAEAYMTGGKHMAIPRDKAKAYYWLSRIADRTKDRDYQYEAALHADDSLEREQWLSKAAAQNHLKAKFLYNNIRGTSFDGAASSRAVAALGAMYQLGHIAVAEHLANVYLRQNNANSIPRAIQWFETFAKNGHTSGYMNIGQIYANSTVIQQDLVKARNYYLKAATQGDVTAMMELANAYDTQPNTLRRNWGLGYQRLGKNAGAARAFWVRASQAGSADARRVLQNRSGQ